MYERLLNDLTTPEQKRPLIMLVLLGLLVFVYNLGVGIYIYIGLEPLPTLDFLYQAAFLSGVVWALKADTRKSAVQSVYCPGLMVSLWYFFVPYHLFKTRAGGVAPRPG